MRYPAGRFFFVVLLAVCFQCLSVAQTSLRVDESEIQIHFNQETVVLLPLNNPSGKVVTARLKLELVDPSGTIRASADRNVTISGRSQSLNVPLHWLSPVYNNKNASDVVWYRLRYRLDPRFDGQGAREPLQGVISVSEITPDFFALEVTAPEFVRPGERYIARVRAVHPVTRRPVAGVSIEGSLDINATDDGDNEMPLLAEPASTNGQGFATIEIPLPQRIDETEIDLKVTGRRGALSISADGSTNVDRDARISLTTDKPLYQPGQTLHVRSLAFDPNHKAIAGQSITLKVLDPEDSIAYRTSITTSRFGIAAAEWPIPPNLRLGAYRIEAEFSEGQYEDSEAATTVQISRYDLPTFIVFAKPDRAYYLPNQSASVAVTAQFVYGEPVRQGHVRVVRETRREWNFREQKWDIDAEQTYEGDVSDQGVFTAQLDLASDQADLAGDSYARFRDLSFAAYFTDAASSRTEQRRFNVRIAREPIHVYVTGFTGTWTDQRPLEFYVSTSYADGAPAQCDVEITVVDKTAKPRSRGRESLEEISLRHVRTNRYGVAKVTGLTIPSDLQHDGIEVLFHAKDQKSATGTHSEPFWSYSYAEPFIQVKTEGAIHRTGDILEVDLRASQSEIAAVVDVESDSGILDSRIVRLHQGRAHVSFQSNEKYQNGVTIVAYATQAAPDDPVWDSRTVWFPHDRDLKVDVTLDKASYRPGEPANVDFRTAGPDGFRKQSALGLVVVDRAVEERQRTEQEFASSRGFCCSWFPWLDNEEISGIHVSDLDKVDLAKPIPTDLDLVAEILLQRHGRPRWHKFFHSNSDTTDLKKLFANQMSSQVKTIGAALDDYYKRTQEYPKTAADIEKITALAGIPFGRWRDPWGRTYRFVLAPSGPLNTFTLVSDGPDQKFNTGDDIQAFHTGWPYFKAYQQPIQRAVEAYHARTGGLVRDPELLKRELAAQGVAFDQLRDPWGRPYQLAFDARGSQFLLTVRSLGPDANSEADDFSLFTAGVDYFDQTRTSLDSALATFYNSAQSFPETMESFRQALASSQIDWNHILDFWSHPYYVTFNLQADYWDRPIVQTYDEYLNRGRQRVRYVPVTRQSNWIHIRSAGRDGIEGTADDFEVAAWSRPRLEQRGSDPAPIAVSETPLLAFTGAIAGLVQDQTGGAIVGADVSVTDATQNTIFRTKSGEDGYFILRNLPVGFYLVRTTFTGFQSFEISRVPVSSSNVTSLDVTLVPGAQTQTVTITEELPLVNTTSATLGGTLGNQTIRDLPLTGRNYSNLLNLKKGLGSPQGPLATPRLREDFPETLLWQPELVSDKQGRAHLRIPLADNITTWKLSIMASTEDGLVGMAEKDIRAFQPFFVEHDPPRFLTSGDEIDLPVILRNYLNQNLQLDVAMKPENWFAALGPQQVRADVKPGESRRQVFSFAAQRPVQDGKNRVTATGTVAGDAIERKITVRPYGLETTQSSGQVFGETTSFELNVPQFALPGGTSAYLKIYPNLAAHVLESIQSILVRPYGCAEQTISSTYPSVLFLRLAKSAQDDSSDTVKRARVFVRLGYERLLTYRESNGGFSYWGKGSADPALTAYALQFLRDAGEFTDVDSSLIRGARAWLVTTSQTDRGRPLLDRSEREDDRRNAVVTAYVTRLLAREESAAVRSGESSQSAGATAVTQALQYLKDEVVQMDEPYLIASYVLTAIETGDHSAAAAGMERLRSLERREGATSYWELETNTPFYGWGRAGRIETTALVLQALSRGRQAGDSSAADDGLISRGLLFLLRNQDRYGIWHSTQATVRVLEAIIAITTSGSPNITTAGASKVPILLDGKEVASVELPPDNQLSGPVTVDLSRYVTPGDHLIELTRVTPVSRASAQLVVGYYVPWSQADASGRRHEPTSAEALRLAVNFNTVSARIGDQVTCNVEAERIAFRGHGMMLAEIGLPPGADVDRASLDRAMNDSGAGINHYDLLPDRLIVYLWPQAGGAKFSFAFKPRFGLRAFTAPSTLYDYYNPDAHATVEPVRFVVQ